MRVYVETNFLLELVLEQEECAACESLIDLAEEQKMELVAPAFSFVEPYATLQRRATSRDQLSQQLVRELDPRRKLFGAHPRPPEIVASLQIA